MRVFCLFCSVLLLSCGSSAERKLRGIWVLDTQKSVDSITDEGQQPAAKPSGLNVFLKSLAANVHLEMEFKKDGTVLARRSILGNGVTESRQWQLATPQKDQLQLRLSEDQFQTYDEWQIEFLDANHFKARVFGQSLELTFRRGDS